MGKVCILSIGINKYLYFPEHNLNFCANDAKIVYDKYSQYPCEYKELLLDEKATRAEILKKLADIKNISRDEDYFIFNFAGHGFTTAKADEEINSLNTLIFTYDFENGYFHTTIFLDELKKAINSIKAKCKFLIFDACHSGGALRRDIPLLREIEINKLIELFAENEGTCIITACASDEVAMEDPELKHGIFTYTLIECLEKASKPNVYYIPHKELHNMVLSAVRNRTENNQNPQIKCSNEDFEILMLPSSEIITKKEIKLNTTIIPTTGISKALEYYAPNDLEKFEQIVIQLIQQNRFIEVNKLIKDEIEKIYTKLSKPDISFHSDLKDAIPYYESCREYIKPLLILNHYIIEYYDPKYIINIIDYIVRFEELTRNKNGYTAIIEIPLIIISEIILNLMSLAYKARNYIILRKLLVTPLNYKDKFSQMAYDYRIWAPYLFENNITTYIKYLFSEKVMEGFFISSNFRDFLEVNFLFDCYCSSNFKFPNVCYPVYTIYENFDVPKRIVSNLLLEDQDLINCIKEVFSINDVNDFLKIVVKRLDGVSEWRVSGFYDNDYYLNPIIGKIQECLGK